MGRRFRLLVLRRLLQSPLRTAMTTVAIAAGVSLAVSISVLITSVDQSLQSFGRGLAGPTELRIVGATLRGGLPMSAVNTAAGVAGVASVVPMVQTVAPVQPIGGGEVQSALVLGVDCRVEVLLGPFGCNPTLLGATKEAIAIGPDLVTTRASVLRTDQGRLALAGAPSVGRLRHIAGGRVVVLPLALAQDLFTRAGQIDVAYVQLTPRADAAVVRSRLQRALGAHLPVLAADAPPDGAAVALAASIPIYSLLGLFALGVGGVLVANTAAMSLETRRRELAVLGALGGRPRTVAGSTVAEMAVLGAAGGLLGSLGGALVAHPIVASLSSYVESLAGAPLGTHISTINVITGLALGIGLGGGAALLPARRATRLDVSAQLSGREPADRGRPDHLGRRAIVWTVVTAVGALGCWAAPRHGGLDPWQAAIVSPAFLAVIVGSLFGGASLAPLLLGRMARATSRTTSGPIRLALAAAVRDHRRTGMLAISVAAAVSTAFATEGASASARASIVGSFLTDGKGVDLSTVPTDRGFGAMVSPDVIARAAALPGVAKVTTGTFLMAGRGRDLVSVETTTGPLTASVVDGAANRRRLDAGEVIIGAGVARRQRVRAGGRVRVTTPEGIVDLPVQGVWLNGNNIGSNITMSPGMLTQLYGPQPPRTVVLRPAPGYTEARLAREVRDAHIGDDLLTRFSLQVASDVADEVDRQFSSFRVMQRALLVVLFVAVLSSLLLAGVQRRRELGLLAAVGADPPSIARTLLLEAGLVGTIGIALCTISGPLTMWALNAIAPFIIGFTNPIVFVWSSLATSGVIALAVVLLGAAWPARTAARVEVLEALRYE